MATGSGSLSIQQPALPVFKGDGYEHWSIKMKTLFRSQELWDLIENGYSEEDDETRLKDHRKKDAKALFFIQQSIHESIFSRIAGALIAKEAWNSLKSEFQGNARIVAIKLQTLKQEFETLSMKANEGVQEYVSRSSEVVNQIRTLGEKVSEQALAAKILRSCWKWEELRCDLCR